MGLLKIIMVAYKRAVPLRIAIDSFLVQSNDLWELHVIHDGKMPEDVKKVCNNYADEKKIKFYESSKRNEAFGHPNRRLMLNTIKVTEDDFILITNDDNYYVPDFVKLFQGRMNKKVGMIYCNMLHNYFNYEDIFNTRIAVNRIDMGAFAVKGVIAKEVGFNSNRMEADGIYAEACAEFCRKKGYEIIKIKNVLFVHN